MDPACYIMYQQPSKFFRCTPDGRRRPRSAADCGEEAGSHRTHRTGVWVMPCLPVKLAGTRRSICSFLVGVFNQWLFLVPLIGGRYYIIPQLAGNQETPLIQVNGSLQTVWAVNLDVQIWKSLESHKLESAHITVATYEHCNLPKSIWERSHPALLNKPFRSETPVICAAFQLSNCSTWTFRDRTPFDPKQLISNIPTSCCLINCATCRSDQIVHAGKNRSNTPWNFGVPSS